LLRRAADQGRLPGHRERRARRLGHDDAPRSPGQRPRVGSPRRYGRRMANPGALDTSFGSGGKKTINFGGTDIPRVVLVQPNGRIVVAGGGGPSGSFCVVRLRTNGTLDTTFGSGGKRIVDFGGENDSAYGGALQADVRIVLAGDSDFRVAMVRLTTS